MQQRIRAEIKEIMDANKGALTYESLLGLKYLGMVFSGAMSYSKSITNAISSDLYIPTL